MPSFSYPQHLLHKTTEPHWFPRLKEETESSLDALEAEEQAYADFLKALSHKEAPDPIGVATASAHNTNAPGNNTPSASSSAAAAAVGPGSASGSQRPWGPEEVVGGGEEGVVAPTSTTASSRPRFWNQSRGGASAATPARASVRADDDSMLESPMASS